MMANVEYQDVERSITGRSMDRVITTAMLCGLDAYKALQAIEST